MEANFQVIKHEQVHDQQSLFIQSICHNYHIALILQVILFQAFLMHFSSLNILVEDCLDD